MSQSTAFRPPSVTTSYWQSYFDESFSVSRPVPCHCQNSNSLPTDLPQQDHQHIDKFQVYTRGFQSHPPDLHPTSPSRSQGKAEMTASQFRKRLISTQSSSSSPIVIMVHGAGHAAMSWATMTKELYNYCATAHADGSEAGIRSTILNDFNPTTARSMALGVTGLLTQGTSYSTIPPRAAARLAETGVTAVTDRTSGAGYIPSLPSYTSTHSTSTISGLPTIATVPRATSVRARDPRSSHDRWRQSRVTPGEMRLESSDRGDQGMLPSAYSAFPSIQTQFVHEGMLGKKEPSSSSSSLAPSSPLSECKISSEGTIPGGTTSNNNTSQMKDEKDEERKQGNTADAAPPPPLRVIAIDLRGHGLSRCLVARRRKCHDVYQSSGKATNVVAGNGTMGEGSEVGDGSMTGDDVRNKGFQVKQREEGKDMEPIGTIDEVEDDREREVGDYWSLERHVDDMVYVIGELLGTSLSSPTSPSYPSSSHSSTTTVPKVLLCGHSFGGAIAIALAERFMSLSSNSSSSLSPLNSLPHPLLKLIGVVIVDAADVSDYDLAATETAIRAQPQSFPSVDHAIRWAVQTPFIANIRSASVSIPYMLRVHESDRTLTTPHHNPSIVSHPSITSTTAGSTSVPSSSSTSSFPSSSRPLPPVPLFNSSSPLPSTTTTPSLPSTTASRVIKWRTPLATSQSYWRSWFEGFSSKLTSLSVPKLLIISHADRMGQTLTVAHMQGKLQVALIRGGHCLQEEEPVAVAGHVARFIHRSLTINTVNAAPHR